MRTVQWPVLCVLGLLALPATAGQHSSAVPTIGSGVAKGSLKVTHDSASTNESIGCVAHVYSDGATQVQCSAVDINGASTWCTSFDPKFVGAVRMINETSYLSFYWSATDTSHTCTRINVENGSQMLP